MITDVVEMDVKLIRIVFVNAGYSANGSNELEKIYLKNKHLVFEFNIAQAFWYVKLGCAN